MAQINQAEPIPPRKSNGDGSFWKAVYGVITATVIGMQAYQFQKVVSHEADIASLKTQSRVDEGKITDMESHGSKALEGYQGRTDTSIKNLQDDVKEMRSWIVPLQGLPPKIDNLVEGQKRIEAALNDHMKEKTK